MEPANIFSAAEAQSPTETYIHARLEVNELADNVDLSVLHTLHVRTRTARDAAGRRVALWQNKLAVQIQKFEYNRGQMAAGGFTNLERPAHFRDAGGMLTQSLLQSSTPERRDWLVEKAEEDLQNRDMIQGCDAEVFVFRDCFNKMNELDRILDRLEGAITMLRAESERLRLGRGRLATLDDTDAWFLGNVAGILEQGYVVVGQVTTALNMPVDATTWTEKQKWKYDHLGQYFKMHGGDE